MANLLIILLVFFVLAPIAKAYAERMSRERLPAAGAESGDVARLREEVERLSSDLTRLQEEQSFMMKLLADGERKSLDEGRHTTQ